MKIAARFASVGLIAALVACGGGGGTGAVVIDFEDRPDDGISTGTYGVGEVLAPGVTVSELEPSTTLLDFSTANNWGLGGCNAVATSGNMMMGSESALGGGLCRVRIAFAFLVRRVQVYASAENGQPIAFEAFDDAGAPLSLEDLAVSACPALDGADLLEVDAGALVIRSVEIRGLDYLAFDDLAYWR